MQILFIFMQYDEIIHISDVAPCMQLLFYKMVELVQVNVREKLARQISNRYPCPSFGAVQNGSDKPSCFPASNLGKYDVAQDLLIY